MHNEKQEKGNLIVDRSFGMRADEAGIQAYRDIDSEFLKPGFGMAYRARTEARDETCQ
jgi:hypothetical protein